MIRGNIDLELKKQIAYRAAKMFLRQEKISRIETIHTGCDVETKILVKTVCGENFLVKTTSNPFFTEEKCELLRKFDDILVYPLKKYIDKDSGVMAIMYPWVSGETLKNILPYNCKEYAKHCVKLLCKLHYTPLFAVNAETDIRQEFYELYKYCIDKDIRFNHMEFWKELFEKQSVEIIALDRPLGIVHGDFKPENIIFSISKEIRLIDIESIVYTDPWQEFIGFTMLMSDTRKEFCSELLLNYFSNQIPQEFFSYLSCTAILALYRTAIWDFHHNSMGNTYIQENYLYNHVDKNTMMIKTWIHNRLEMR